MTGSEGSQTTPRTDPADPRLEAAVNLFEFLGRAQQLKTSPPRTTDAYARDGSVTWFHDLPSHRAITTSHRAGNPDPEAPLLVIDRVPRVAAPQPDGRIRAWVTEPLDDPNSPPTLRNTVPARLAPEVASTREGREHEPVALEDVPEVRDGFAAWLPTWQAWAEQERADRPVRDLYGQLFSTYVTAGNRQEELELVLGVGCLAWAPAGHDRVKRHLLTSPARIRFDDDSGRLTVLREQGLDPITIELDMLDPGLIADAAHINSLKALAREFDAHPLHRDEIGAIARRLVHSLDADGEYRDEDEGPQPASLAVACYAPALILRKRSQQGLVEIFQTIVQQLQEAGEVPSGILPLVDPDHRPESTPDPTPGGVVAVDDAMFLPLPVNETQLKILRNVDQHAQTLVQGPPGTGKTHTAAALLSHLLAQGKRVLVAAHTDRALYEVRDKLPPAIKPLSVAVVGGSRSDLADLKVAVEHIAATAADHDQAEAEATIASTLDRIDQLRRQRAQAHQELLDARRQEVEPREHRGYAGTLAAMAQTYQADAHAHGWISEYVNVPSASQAPLDDADVTQWHRFLVDEILIADEPDSRQRLIDLDSLPDPTAFANLCRDETSAASGSQAHADLTRHQAFDAIQALAAADRTRLQLRMRWLAQEAAELEQRHEAWMKEALFDIRANRAGLWQARANQIHSLIDHAQTGVDLLGPITRVSCTGGDAAALTALARTLSQHLSTGGSIKVAGDGQPKLGAFTAKPVKEARPLFEQVLVDGLPPVSVEALNKFLTFDVAERTIDAIDRAWPATVIIPAEDTLQERLQWHRTELEQLHRVLVFGDRLAELERDLVALNTPVPDWNDLAVIRTYAELVDAATAADAWDRAVEPLAALEATLEDTTRWADAAPCIHALHLAVRNRDHDLYGTAHARLRRMRDVVNLTALRDSLGERLRAAAPDLHSAISANPFDERWSIRLPGFAEAWAWGATGAWILEQDTTDVNALQVKITLLEGRIRREVETLAATRAWNHAVSAHRLTGEAKADLAHYAFLVRRLGKGTGKYAAQQRAEIRKAMDRCRPAVPVWIMPIYRIAEQLRIHSNMFDVVVVDEASQAGLEATFLQYLAPKIVVIGDDKQVSPAAVGVDQQQLRDLANQFLANDRYRAAWQDPTRSLFDEAVMRYGSRITLTEHRRCVPEIIGFSNKIAYEPDGVRLIPVRQFGADRLEPIKPVHITDGYERGTNSKINSAEVDAVVEQIEKCLADPRYDGLTFGVISLLGTAQAKTIEKALLDRIPPEEWAARDLRCGDAADFQGSERDVMFLSMVAAPEPNRRLGALTRDLYVQRYNVAFSRAKDQVWLFHSIGLQDVGNPEDMRFQLLDYCYGVVGRNEAEDEGIIRQAVPEDVRVEPFDSLFEQRVFNRLLDRGYTVIPQYHANGYKIDLVVVGAKSRLAVECDGDAWHGPDAYEADLARQRDLERCGWEFFRVRESAFYVDQAGELESLWEALDELNIYPSGWQADALHGPGPALDLTARGDEPHEQDLDTEQPTVHEIEFEVEDEIPVEIADEVFAFETGAPAGVDASHLHELAPSVADLRHQPPPTPHPTTEIDE
ncbi:MAG: AAA domain-containing protein, partial [Actinomycetes bacterium]